MTFERPNLIEMRYFATYEYASMCESAIWNPSNLKALADFWDGFVVPEEDNFNKYSLLHYLIATVIENVVHKDFWDRQNSSMGVGSKYFYANEMLDFHDKPFQDMGSWSRSNGNQNSQFPEEDSAEYYGEILMSDEYDSVFTQIVNEVFFILFLNREFLQKFNEYISEIREMSYGSEWPKCKRIYMPKWVKRAVFYRERGCCALCKKNISGLININGDIEYDHIVPLNNYGVNDISNIQLLCKKCNLKKRDGKPITSRVYENWY